MLQNREKVTLIVEVCGAQRDNAAQNILKLLDILIQEVRIDNDTAGPETFRLNQGEIAGYTKLQEYITRGLPGSIRVA